MNNFSYFLASVNNCMCYYVSLIIHFLLFAEYRTGASPSELTEELLLIFPVLALVSSPSRSIKQTATSLLSILGKTATYLLIAPRKEQAGEGQNLTITTPGHIVFRFIKNILFKVYINHLP